ncbi:MAG: hypothetical protein H6661_13570 [Ardenticatenaceae bacterium]|nr:hypothetical protein [Ardenticatenaceae bacterium]
MPAVSMADQARKLPESLARGEPSNPQKSSHRAEDGCPRDGLNTVRLQKLDVRITPSPTDSPEDGTIA